MDNFGLEKLTDIVELVFFGTKYIDMFDATYLVDSMNVKYTYILLV